MGVALRQTSVQRPLEATRCAIFPGAGCCNLGRCLTSCSGSALPFSSLMPYAQFIAHHQGGDLGSKALPWRSPCDRKDVPDPGPTASSPLSSGQFITRGGQKLVGAVETIAPRQEDPAGVRPIEGLIDMNWRISALELSSMASARACGSASGVLTYSGGRTWIYSAL